MNWEIAEEILHPLRVEAFQPTVHNDGESAFWIAAASWKTFVESRSEQR